MSRHWDRVELGQCGACGKSNPNSHVINYCPECLHEMAIEERRKWTRDMRLIIVCMVVMALVISAVVILELSGIVR